MIHIAIMKKSWGLTSKIITGQKKIESRWYKLKYSPWGKIEKGDTVYFKNSGELVSIKSEVKKVIQFTELNRKRVKDILGKYGKNIGINKSDFAKFSGKFRDKEYCILIFLKNPKKIKPFQINKKGFGAMSSWITVKNIEDIKV